MLFTILRVLICFLAFVCSTIVSAQSPKRLLKEGDRYYAHGKYRAALQYYKQGGNPQTWEPEIKLKAAICQYEINEIDGAVPLFAQLVQEGKTDPQVYLYLARCYHHMNQFTQAVNFYKQFLRKEEQKGPLRAWVKDETIRCANGISMRFGVERAYVENMGAVINAFGDDYAPVPSPNYDERVYFTSARESSTGGMVDANGASDPKYGNYTTDIYYTENTNGVWNSPSPLDQVMNTKANEEILCFSMDGQQMFFTRSKAKGQAELIVDTFSIATRNNTHGSNLGPYRASAGDRDLVLFNDTIMLFASNRAGGEGGYDLYFAVNRKGRWKDAINLGPAINSFYDEVSPFLTRNGRMLYFSSNRLESIGGLDIFSAVFDNASAYWQPPVNLGLPINSAGDDRDFWLTPDGLKAYLSSDRKTGYGESDLYSAYFKEQVREHLALSIPVTFIQVVTDDELAVTPTITTPQEIREYVISDLWFEPNDVVITPQNIRKLEVLSNLMLIYPSLKIDLIGHDVASGPRSYDLFFSIKKAEQAASYLVKKGISADRIYVKGVGAFYPIANTGDQPVNSASVARLNRRIELHVYDAEGQPVTLSEEEPVIPETLKDMRGVRFDTLQEQLVYRVQIARVAQLLQHKVFDEYSDAMIAFDVPTRMYHYMIGMETKYRNALVMQEALKTQGFGDAIVVPYYHGRPVSRTEAATLLERFPDLAEFVGQ